MFYRTTIIINQLYDIGKVGNALVHRDSLNSLTRFSKGKLDIPFSDIDALWLKKYEQWMRGNGYAETTMSISFRTLRSVYNRAIEEEIARKSSYPFDKFKISKFNTKTEKRAIPKNTILKIMNLDLQNESFYVQFARDIFIFSYLCGGINFKDIAHLSSQNIVNNRLSYVRRKTSKRINIPLKAEAIQIIKKYSTITDAGYLFPILNNKVHKTKVQQYDRIQKVIGKINKELKVVAKIADIDVHLTTYVASVMSTLQSRKIILSLHQKTAMIKYHVTLTETERTELLNITSVMLILI